MEEEREEQEEQIGTTTKWLMVITAAFVDFILKPLCLILDIVGIGSALNWAIDIGMYITFFIWFKIHGVTFTKKNRMIKFFGISLLELIPWLNAVIPGWTLSVWLTANSTRKNVGT